MTTHHPPPPAASARPPADLNPRREAALDFPERELEEMTPADYDTLGFLCGLEVHQQLATRSKLFCRCPSGVVARRVDAEVLRHMRPTLSELGEYDGTALMEFKTRKEIVYRLERSSVCTYEMDDTPPFEVDEEAVRTAIAVSRLFELNLVSELHVMRKQYLDGSIPTGFQRTAMVGLAGEIPFRESELGRDRVLRIRQLSLEEDSCREVSDVGHRIIFRTDRLGTPLTETVTEPDLLTPRDAAAGGRLIAAVTRTTGMARRGPGAARQDVNVSIAGGRRVEIKGVCHHRGLPRLVHVEAFRQLALLRIKAELEARGIRKEMLTVPETGQPWEQSPLAIDARSLLRKTDYSPIRDALDRDEMVVAVRLPGFRGLLAHGTQPGLTFAQEILHRVRVIACLVGRPFMIHSDVRDYGLRASRWRQLRSASGAASGDAVVVLWGRQDDAATAVREVLARGRDALDGVPAETRQAFADGTTGFERILPGPDRMYPDTDTPPLPIPDRWVQDVEAKQPARPWEREDRAIARGLDAAAAHRLARAPWNDLFEALAPKTPLGARRMAAALEKRLPCHWRRTRSAGALPDAERLEPLVAALDRGGPVIHAADEILDRLLAEPEHSASSIVASYEASDEPSADLARLLEATVVARDALSRPPSDERALMQWAMGRVIPELLGRVEPEEVARRLAERFGAKAALTGQEERS